MKLKKEFEDWFLNLNRDFGEEELVQLRNCEQYFYTSTKALYDQFCTIAQLKERIDELGGLLETSVTGLEWFLSEFPLEHKNCDDEHLAACKAAILQQKKEMKE